MQTLGFVRHSRLNDCNKHNKAISNQSAKLFSSFEFQLWVALRSNPQPHNFFNAERKEKAGNLNCKVFLLLFANNSVCSLHVTCFVDFILKQNKSCSEKVFPSSSVKMFLSSTCCSASFFRLVCTKDVQWILQL